MFRNSSCSAIQSMLCSVKFVYAHVKDLKFLLNFYLSIYRFIFFAATGFDHKKLL
jgi:hypothetical protein